MLPMSRDLGCSYKASLVLAHKMRESMAFEVRQTAIGGEGNSAEIDGGYVKLPTAARIALTQAAATPNRQAQGRRCDPRARRGR